MKFSTKNLLLSFLFVGTVQGFQTAKPVTTSSTALNGYVPDGFTAKSYAKFKAEEKKKQDAKNLGRVGPKGFKSRSFQSFQEALERGETSHLMPVLNAKQRVASGELKKEDIPYMQRGGSWDNSDVKGAKKARWLKSDVEYANGRYSDQMSFSILGVGSGLDWTGKNARKGPAETVQTTAPKFAKNYKPPNVKDMQQKETSKKKFFGLF